MTELSELEPLVGRWATTITMLYPPDAQGEQYLAVDTYRWLPGQNVLVHDVQARMAGKSVNSLEVYTSADGILISRSFDSSGTVSDYSVRMLGGVWSVHGATERFESTSITSDTIEGLWLLKVDNCWVDWMTVRLDRVAGA